MNYELGAESGDGGFLNRRARRIGAESGDGGLGFVKGAGRALRLFAFSVMMVVFAV